MSLGVKILATTLGIAGGGSIVPLTLWQTGYIGNVGTEVTQQDTHSDIVDTTSLRPDSSVSREETQKKIEEAKNCIVISKDSEQDILQSLGISNKDYSVISCENTGVLANKWKGYFPDDVFKDKLEATEKFEMKTIKDDDLEEEDEITFVSTKFSEGYVVGELESEAKPVNNKKITVVNLEGGTSDYEKAYLLFESQDR